MGKFNIDLLHLLTCQKLLYLFKSSANMISPKIAFCKLNIYVSLSIDVIKEAYELSTICRRKRFISWTLQCSERDIEI